MALTTAVIDRLFDRLMFTYGREWTNKWEGVEIVGIKSMWSHELSMFADNLKAIGWALENLPDKCPNLIEFKNLCRQAPRPEFAALPTPKANPEIVYDELSKIVARLAKPQTDNVDHKRWAKKLKARHDAGEKLSMYQIQCYKTALQEAT